MTIDTDPLFILIPGENAAADKLEKFIAEVKGAAMIQAATVVVESVYAIPVDHSEDAG